jgi:hypothetical protein
MPKTCNDKQELCDNYKIKLNYLIKIIELVYSVINIKAIKNYLIRLSNALFELDIPNYDNNGQLQHIE